MSWLFHKFYCLFLGYFQNIQNVYRDFTIVLDQSDLMKQLCHVRMGFKVSYSILYRSYYCESSGNGVMLPTDWPKSFIKHHCVSESGWEYLFCHYLVYYCFEPFTCRGTSIWTAAEGLGKVVYAIWSRFCTTNHCKQLKTLPCQVQSVIKPMTWEMGGECVDHYLNWAIYVEPIFKATTSEMSDEGVNPL